MDSISPLVKRLLEQQTVLDLDDEAFAARLHVSRPQWILIKSGQMRPGLSLMAGVTLVFPGLKDIVIEELQSRGRERHSSVA